MSLIEPVREREIAIGFSLLHTKSIGNIRFPNFRYNFTINLGIIIFITRQLSFFSSHKFQSKINYLFLKTIGLD